MSDAIGAAGARIRKGLERSRRVAAWAALGAAIAAAGQAAAQVPMRLAGIDVYRTAQLDAESLERRHAKAIGDFVAAMAANDERALERLYTRIVESIRASGDFAHVDLELTTAFERDENVVHATIELVDRAHAAERLSFDPEPTGSFADPEGVLEAWSEYQRTGFELLQARQIAARADDCPAHHCFVGFGHEKLAPYLERFDRAAREHRDELVRILRADADASKRGNAAFVLAHAEDARELVRDLVPSLDDPADVVRNNVMRVLLMIALRDDGIEIPFEPLSRRLDDPDGGCRNKAVSLMAALARRSEYRDRILESAPALMRLLRLEKPNTHDPAYDILKTISGEAIGERDYAGWAAWIEQARLGADVETN